MKKKSPIGEAFGFILFVGGGVFVRLVYHVPLGELLGLGTMMMGATIYLLS